MGNWSISLKGTGQHHNTIDGKSDPKDADALFMKFIADLVDAGQYIEHASIYCGNKQEVVLERGKPKGQ